MFVWRQSFSRSYLVLFWLDKKVCTVAASASTAKSAFPTLEAGQMFSTKYGIVSVVADARAIPNTESANNDETVLARRLKVYYSACTKRQAQRTKQAHAVAVTSRARRMLLSQLPHQDNDSSSGLRVSDAYRVSVSGGGGGCLASSPPPPPPPLDDPSAPPESYPNRLVECQWLADHRTRVVVDNQGNGETVLDGLATNSPLETLPPPTITSTATSRRITSVRLFLQRRLLTNAYNESTIRYYCPQCWQCFLSRPGIKYHCSGGSESQGCRRKVQQSIQSRQRDLALIEQQACQLATSFAATVAPRRAASLARNAAHGADDQAAVAISSSAAGSLLPRRTGPRVIWVDPNDETKRSLSKAAETTSDRIGTDQAFLGEHSSIAIKGDDAMDVDTIDTSATTLRTAHADSDEPLVSPNDVIAQLESELYRVQGQMIGPMYPQVFKALGYLKPRKAKPPRHRPVVPPLTMLATLAATAARGNRQDAVAATAKAAPMVKVTGVSPAEPPHLSALGQSNMGSLGPPPLCLEHAAPLAVATDSKVTIVDVRTLVQEVDAGRYPTIQRFDGRHDGYCAICKLDFPPKLPTTPLLLFVPPSPTEWPLNHVFPCNFCARSVHLACIRSKYIVKEPEPVEDFLCHHCINVILARRSRAEKRRQEKYGDEPSSATDATSAAATVMIADSTNDEAMDTVDLCKGVVANREFECVAAQARQIGDLTELLRDSQSRLAIGLATEAMNQARRARLELS
jgi:hypothetical protein